ncbi:hypothetical protein J4E06_03585 [Muricauda sp. NFXS6]|uniref:hypothetical protein n=1 Tax=Allomuricauda sp. NFXS6 TaxID=2819094 RepID=UPI0032DE46C9
MQFFKMKSSVNRNAFFPIATFVLAILLGSCENEVEQNLLFKESQTISLLFDKAEVEKAELKEKLVYKNYHLTNLMEEVLRSNLDFDQKMGKKSEKVQGLRSFYFDDLLSEDIAGKGRRTNNDSIQFSLSAFIDLDGGSWHSYVYKIKEGRGSQPLFLINSYDPDMEKEIVQGYKLGSAGQLELKYRDLSEDDVFGPNPVQGAIGNDIYVLGISPEDQEAMLPEPFEAFNDGEIPEPSSGEGSSGGGGGTSNTYVKIQYVKIKDKKESWLEKADVKFEVVTATASSLTPGNFRTHCGYNVGLGCYWNGSFLVHCNNNEVGDKRLVNRDMGIIQQGDLAKIAVYVIFEYDSWPAGKEVFEKTLNGETLKVGYRSYQSTYDEQVVNFHSQNPFNLKNGKNLTINNNDIEYNLK